MPSDIVRTSQSRTWDIPTDSVFVGPERKRRTLNHGDAKDRRLVESIKTRGIIKPIEVRPVEEKYELIFGRRRLAAAQHLAMVTVPAHVGDWTDDQLAFIAAAEETGRHKSRNAVEYFRRLKVMLRQMEACFGPDPGRATGGITRSRRASRDPATSRFVAAPRLEPSEEGRSRVQPSQFLSVTSPESDHVRSFRWIMSELYGVDPRTAGDDLKIARVFAEDQFEALLGRELARGELLRIAKLKSEEARSEAVDLIVRGESARGAVTLTVFQCKSVETPTSSRTQGIPDCDWLITYCARVRRQLQDPRIFDRDAVIYRRLHEARAVFGLTAHDQIKRALTQGPSPLAQLLNDALNVEHPKNWQVCSKCQGRNQEQPQCDRCGGRGYELRFKGPKQK